MPNTASIELFVAIPFVADDEATQQTAVCQQKAFAFLKNIFSGVHRLDVSRMEREYVAELRS